MNVFRPELQQSDKAARDQIVAPPNDDQVP